MNFSLLHKYKKDLYFFAGLFIFIVASFLIFMLLRPEGSGNQAVISCADTVLIKVPLQKDAQYLFKDGSVSEVSAGYSIETDPEAASHSLNLIIIKSGTVSVAEANCADHICVQTGSIAADGDGKVIACLPHRLVITVE